MGLIRILRSDKCDLTDPTACNPGFEDHDGNGATACVDIGQRSTGAENRNANATRTNTRQFHLCLQRRLHR